MEIYLAKWCFFFVCFGPFATGRQKQTHLGGGSCWLVVLNLSGMQAQQIKCACLTAM